MQIFSTLCCLYNLLTLIALSFCRDWIHKHHLSN
nr:MAG TPA: hypothetical protein [Caudoviricetes sp.]